MNIKNTPNQSVANSFDRHQLEREAIIDELISLMKLHQETTDDLINLSCNLADWEPGHPADFMELIKTQLYVNELCSRLEILGTQFQSLICDIKSADQDSAFGLFKNKLFSLLEANDERSIAQFFNR